MQEYNIYIMSIEHKQMKVYFKDSHLVLPAGDLVLVDNQWHELIYDPLKDDLIVDGKSVEDCIILDRKHKSRPTHGLVAKYFNNREMGLSHEESVKKSAKILFYEEEHIVEYEIRYYKPSMIQNRFDMDAYGNPIKKPLIIESLFDFDFSEENPKFYYYKKDGKNTEKLEMNSNNLTNSFTDIELAKGIQLSLF